MKFMVKHCEYQNNFWMQPEVNFVCSQIASKLHYINT